MSFTQWNRLSGPLVVLFYLPLLIRLGAGAKQTDGIKRFYNRYKPGGWRLSLIIIVTILLLVGLAHVYAAESCFILLPYQFGRLINI
jgi:hypothetical protein